MHQIAGVAFLRGSEHDYDEEMGLVEDEFKKGCGEVSFPLSMRVSEGEFKRPLDDSRPLSTSRVGFVSQLTNLS